MADRQLTRKMEQFKFSKEINIDNTVSLSKMWQFLLKLKLIKNAFLQVSMGLEKIPLESAMLLINQTVVAHLFFRGMFIVLNKYKALS